MTSADVAAFEASRRRLLAVAYRMLGSAADAEEIVQDAYLRWQQSPRDDVESPEAYLVTIVTRLCLDRAALARSHREVYVGPWLPEPINEAWQGMHDPSVADRDDVSLAFLVVLETLSPLERAVFVLHEVFDYEHKEIAAFLDRDVAACRKLLERAKAHVASRKARYQPSDDEHRMLLMSFLTAIAMGDVDGIRKMLADSCTMLSDGGGRVHAAINPVRGSDAVARFLVGTSKKRNEPFALAIEMVNDRPMAVLRRPDASIIDVLDVVSDGTSIVAVYAVRNPEKLGHLPPPT